VSVEDATAIVDTFLATPFSGEERHQRRLDMVTRYEATGELPPLSSAEG
jgi:ribose 5-phosphate isomerase B